MIYITGDIHGDKSRFKAARRAGIRKGDTLLVCGDFGFVWDGSREEKKLLKWIGKRGYQVLFVDGCNENHRLLAEYPEEELCGGKVRTISGKLHMLMRGELYEIEGKRVFAFGGGNSLERYASNQNDALLLPSGEELENARRHLEEAGNEVDLIVTHDAPAKLRQFIDIENLDDLTHLQAFLEEVSRTVRFKWWYIGKYHLNKVIPPHYSMVFTNVVKYEG